MSVRDVHVLRARSLAPLVKARGLRDDVKEGMVCATEISMPVPVEPGYFALAEGSQTLSYVQVLRARSLAPLVKARGLRDDFKE